MVKIRCFDKVIILTGNDKGKIGLVKKVINTRLIVNGINLMTKHKKKSSLNIKGGIFKKECFIDISNVAIFNDFLKKKDRVFFKFINKKKIRFFKSNGKTIR